MMRLNLIFRDRDGNQATASTHRARPATLAQVAADVNQFASAASPLSNARVVAASAVFKFEVVGAASAGPQSRVARSLLLVLRSAQDVYASILVPSASTALPYDTVGPYAGVRISPETMAVAGGGVAVARQYIQQGVVRPDGQVVQPEQIVAGLTLNGGG